MEPENSSVYSKKVIDLSDRFFIIIAILVIGFVVSYVGSMIYQFDALPKNTPQHINVSGEGRVFVKPDIAQVTFGMETTGLKSQEVVDRNNQVMNEVITAIKGLGVSDKDIQTTGYNLNPLYDYTDKGRVFRGYSLSQQIRVKIRNFDIISDVLDGAVNKGANTVGDLQFTVDDPVKVQAEARAKAIEQAKMKATELAGQSGLKIDKLVNVSEGYYPASPSPMYGMGGGLMAETAKLAPTIATGQMEVISTVTLTYMLK